MNRTATTSHSVDGGSFAETACPRNRELRKLLVLCLALMPPLALPVLAAGPAVAGGTPHCLTKAEWSRIRTNNAVTVKKFKSTFADHATVYSADQDRNGDRTVYMSVRQCLANGRPAPNWDEFHNSVDVYFSNYVYSPDYTTKTRTKLAVEDLGSWSRPYAW